MTNNLRYPFFLQLLQISNSRSLNRTIIKDDDFKIPIATFFLDGIQTTAKNRTIIPTRNDNRNQGRTLQVIVDTKISWNLSYRLYTPFEASTLQRIQSNTPGRFKYIRLGGDIGCDGSRNYSPMIKNLRNMTYTIRMLDDTQDKIPILTAIKLRTQFTHFAQQTATHARYMAGEHGAHHGIGRPIRLEMWLGIFPFLGKFILITIDKIRLVAIDA
ncbi:hypothetical protein SAMN04244547_03039 [Azotobacter vinelandii]|nr:hypothetical protein SAMN04244547_03039 [Azotobacter vinelandii]